MIELKEFVQHNMTLTDEFLEVKGIAEELLSLLNQEEVLNRITLANQPMSKSKSVQLAFEQEAMQLGFTSEKKGLFSGYKTPGLRPDYYKAIGKSGILLEVERGKTTQNNMDLLDMWKCHICKEADYLFLMVPKELRQNNSGKIERTFYKVCNRVEAFYEEINYINVKATYIYGY